MNKLIKAAVTLSGSVGYEYPSLGIPTVICNETLYSGKGFNYEPKTIEEYFKFLINFRHIIYLFFLISNRYQIDELHTYF